MKYALPSIRAMIANELMRKHHLTQMQAAIYLELDQSAISLYHQRRRGNFLPLENDGDIQQLITKQANVLVKDDLIFIEKLKLFCEVCKVIRSKGFLCSIHKAADPTVDKNCNFCRTNVCPGLSYYL